MTVVRDLRLEERVTPSAVTGVVRSKDEQVDVTPLLLCDDSGCHVDHTPAALRTQWERGEESTSLPGDQGLGFR